MNFSLMTIVVVVANGLTAVTAAALLMLVLWQAPGRRMNLLFAFAMVNLGAYSLANAGGRFIDDLGFNRYDATYIAIMFYGFFILGLYLFSTEFAGVRTRFSMGLALTGILLIVVHTAALWSNLLIKNIEPTPGGDGSYTGEWTLAGYGVIISEVVFLGVTAAFLYRLKDERGHSLWQAPVLVILGMGYSAFIWPIFQLPLQAVFLLLAALAMGAPVLRFELFNPMAQLNIELGRTHRELREMSYLKTQFLKNMSHELRTPLNSIIGYTQLVLNGTYGELNETQDDRLQKVIRNGNNLLNLINDVLDLNRIETGMVHLERNMAELTTMLDYVVDTVEPLAAQKGLIITREFDEMPALYVDEARMTQVFTNILANAIKFTQEGGITVRAQLIESGTMVQIEFIDTGIGIPRDQWDKVFEEFRQVDNSSTRKYEGTGLGMAITKRLIELHGGRIWLNSIVSVGTTFFVALPVQPGLPEYEQAPAALPSAMLPVAET